MNYNYNSFGFGASAPPENQVWNSTGTSPTSSMKNARKSWFLNLVLMLLVLTGSNMFAQLSNYTFASSTGTYSAVTGGTQLIASGVDSGASAVTNIGFNFVYDGTTYTQFSATSNGWIRLGATAGTSGGTTPLSSPTGPAIALFARDAKTGAPVVYSLTGTAPNQVLTVDFPTYYPYWGATTPALNMQVKLYETTNKIEIIYGGYTSGTSYTGQVGIGSTSSTNYNNRTTTTSWSASAAGTASSNSMTLSSTVFPASGQTYTWTPPVPCSGAPTAGTVAPATRPTCTGVAPGNFVVTGYSTGVTGITFQWLESSSSTGPFATPAVGGSGATTDTYTPPIFAGTTIYYVCRVNCTATSTYADTTPVSVTAPAAPSTQASAMATSAYTSSGMSASWTNGNGTRRVVYMSDSSTFTDPVNGNAAALTANTVYAGSGQQIIFDGTGTSVAVTGLALGTTYYFKVYDYARCGAGPYDYYYNVTTGTNAASGTTCGAYSLPYSQNFETAVVPALPTCTSVQNAGTGNNWVTVSNPGSGFTSKALRYGYNFSNAANSWYYTSALNLTAGTSYTISYKYGNDSTSYVEKLKVAYGTSPIASAMTNSIADHPTINTAVANNNSVIFTPPTSGIYYFGFNAYSIANQNGLMVDDIVVKLTPTCYVPTGLTASNLTSSSADVSWTAPTTGSTPIQYEYAVTTSATPPTSGTVTTATSITGIAIVPLTNYYLHVRSECTLGTDYSDWASSVAFKYLPGDNCSSAINLASLTSPYNGDTTGAANDFTNTCASGNTSPDLIYYIDVPNAYTLVIGQTANGYDSENTLFYGGTCPGTTQIACYDDPDDQNTTWTNTTGSSQRVYWVQDGYFDATNFGTFTLAWALTPPPIVVTSFAPSTICSSDLATSTITLTGSNFTGATNVKLNGASETFTVVDDTHITVNLSGTSTAGTFVVYNAVTSGTNATALVINVNPTVAPIVGNSEVCTGSTVTLSCATLGGTWTSSNNAIATVSASGVVTPLTAGTVTISYSYSELGCPTIVTHAITINQAVAIGTQPVSQTTVTGSNLTFSVAATGTGLTYQWVENDGISDVDIIDDTTYSGATTNTLTITAAPFYLDGYTYTCIVTGTGSCTPLSSSTVTLTVGDTGIATQPSNVNLCGSGSASFTVVGSSSNPFPTFAYAWEEDRGGDNWMPLTNGGIYADTNTATLNLSGLSITQTGWRYRCIVTDGNSATSNPALLTVNTAASVTNPANQSVCYSGGTASFSVTPSGSYTGIQWQYSADNTPGSWTSVANGTPTGATYATATTSTLGVTTTTATTTGYYRAMVTAIAPCTDVASASAQLIINTPTVTAPTAATAMAGNSTAFTSTVTATGTVTYQWQRATTLAGTYTNVVDATPANVTYTGADTATLTVVTTTATAASTANYYRLVVTSDGCSINTSGAQLTISNYCTPGSDVATTYLTNFVTTTGLTNISNSSAGYSTAGYGNFTGQSVSQYKNSSVSFATTIVGGSLGTAIWVDWNQNRVFETTERVYNTTGYGYDTTGTFSVPSTALTGTTRMRVLVDYNASNPSNPCADPTGRREIEDYSFIVVEQPACSGTPVAPVITAGVANICVSGTTTFSATGINVIDTGLTYQWYNTAGAISGANSTTFTTPVLTAPETYFMRVTCANGGATADTNSITIGINNPTVDSTTPATRCGTGTVNLEATGSAGTSLNWYAAATGGAPLGTGATFTTPSIAADTTYYVSAGIGATSVNLGAANTAISTSLSSQTTTTSGINFNVNVANVTINSMTVYPTATIGSAYTIQVKQGSTNIVAYSGVTTVSGTTTAPVAQVIPVNFSLPIGSYQVVASVNPGFIRNSGGDAFPYNSTLINMTSSTLGGYFYNFYNWSVSNGCSSARIAVQATVTPPPALTISAATASICAGNTTVTPVTVTSTLADYDSYTWSPSTGVIGSLAAGFTFNPATTTTYTLTGTNAAGCANTATFVVTVNANPTAFTFSPVAPQVCANAALPIAVSVGSLSSPASGGCLSTSYGLYPSTTSTAATCDGTTPTSITTAGYAGEYSNVNVSANYKYVFTSTGSGDYVTISDATGTTVYAAGPSPVTYFSATAEVVRFYTHTNNLCGEAASSRTRSYTCKPSDPAVWSPTTGLYSDAGGTIAYTGTAAITVYAHPTTQTVYTATVTNAAGCSVSNTVTVNIVTPTIFYADIDGDGFGNSAATLLTCVQPAGYVTNSTDCNDNNPNINPGHVEVLYNGIDDNCDGNLDEGHQLITKVKTTQCGTTLATLGSIVYSQDIVNLASAYRYRVVNNTTGVTQYLVKTDATKWWFQFNQLSSYAYSTTYKIDVELQVAGTWLGYYGASCLVTTPSVTGTTGGSTLNAASCGITLATYGQNVSCNPVSGATAYRIKLTDATLGTSQTLDRSLNWFNLTMFPSMSKYATTYTVEVAVRTATSDFGAYGLPCSLTTPSVSGLNNCGAVAVNRTTTFITASKERVISYRFELTNTVTNAVQLIDRPTTWFNFSQCPNGFTVSTPYTVRVAYATVAGVYSDFNLGAPCTITSPAALVKGLFTDVDDTTVATQEVFKVLALPNPFTFNFGLDLTSFTDSNVTIQIYDMIGKLLESREVKYTEVVDQAMGDNYPSGVYNVIVSQGANAKTLRVIKR